MSPTSVSTDRLQNLFRQLFSKCNHNWVDFEEFCTFKTGVQILIDRHVGVRQNI